MSSSKAGMSARRPVDTRKEADKLNVPLGARALGRALKSLWLAKVKNFILDCNESHGLSMSARLAEGLHFVRDQYLPCLEFDVASRMTPDLARFGRLKEILVELSDTRNKVPTSVARKAAQLFTTFEDMGWDALPPRPQPSLSGDYPPDDHPIFGTGGIAEGLVVRRGPRGNLRYARNDRLPKRDAQHFGHNGKPPGFWVPRRSNLLYWGLHGQLQRGIDGDPRRGGAYSIVISGGEYEDTDRDEGDVVYYSAEGARGKDAGRKEAVRGNRALHRSRQTGYPVRVLRSAKAARCGRFAPPCGIRYDGLYQVVGVERRMNKDGGHYQRFKLERMPDQPSLEDIIRTSPTPQQQADYSRMWDGY